MIFMHKLIFSRNLTPHNLILSMPPATKVSVYSDGGSRGNPGPGAIGILLFDESGKEILLHSEKIGTATNNIAEYSALIKGLELAHKLSAREVHCFSDSELAIRQASGKYKVKNKKLLELYLKLKEKEKLFKKVTYRHVPRENPHITKADALVNKALDEAGY
jgi:ribonuclease HI